MSSGSDSDTCWLRSIKALKEEVEKDILAMTDLTENEIKAIKKEMESTTDNNSNHEENTLKVGEEQKTASTNNETDIKLTEKMNVTSSKQEPESDFQYSFKFNKDMKEETDDKYKHEDLTNITKQTSIQSENEDSEITTVVNELASEPCSTTEMQGNEIEIETVDNLKKLADNKLVGTTYEEMHSGETQELNKRNNTQEEKEDGNREQEKIDKDNVKNYDGENDQQCDSMYEKPSMEKEIINREPDSDTMKKDTTINDQLNITEDQVGTEKSTEVTGDVKNAREIISNYKTESTREDPKTGIITSLIGKENTNNEKVTEDKNIILLETEENIQVTGERIQLNTNTDNVKENDGINNERVFQTKHNFDNTKEETFIAEVIVIDDDEMEIEEHLDEEDCVFKSEITQGSNNETFIETNSDDSKLQSGKMIKEINIQVTYSEPPDSPEKNFYKGDLGIVGGKNMNSSEIIKEYIEGREVIESNETIGHEDKKKVTNECQQKEMSLTEIEEEGNGGKRPATMKMEQEPNTDKEKAVKQIEDDSNSKAKITMEIKLNKRNSENKTEEVEINTEKESSEPQEEQQLIPDEDLQESNENHDQNTLKLVNKNEIINQTKAENEPNEPDKENEQNIDNNTDQKNESDVESEQNKDNNGDKTNESVEANEPDEKKNTDDEKEPDEDNVSDKNNETENENGPNDKNDTTNEKEPECFKFKDGIISLEEDYGLDSKEICKNDVMKDKDGDGDDADVTQYSIIIINNDHPTTENIGTQQITVRQSENMSINQVIAAKKFYLTNIKNIQEKNKKRKTKFARNTLKNKLQMMQVELDKLIKCYKTSFENVEPSHSRQDAELIMKDNELINHESEIAEKQTNSSDKGEHLSRAREEKECLEQSQAESEPKCTSEENKNSIQSTEEQEEYSIEISAIKDKQNHTSGKEKELPITKQEEYAMEHLEINSPKTNNEDKEQSKNNGNDTLNISEKDYLVDNEGQGTKRELENPESTDNVDKEIKKGNELKIENEGCIRSNEPVVDNVNKKELNLQIEKRITDSPASNLVTGQGENSIRGKEGIFTNNEKDVRREFLNDTSSSLSGSEESEEFHDALDFFPEEKLKKKEASLILKSTAEFLSPLADLFEPLPGPSGVITKKIQQETKSEKHIPAVIKEETMSDGETEGEYEEAMEFDTAENMTRETEKQNKDNEENEEEKDKNEDRKKNARKNEDFEEGNPLKKMKLSE